MKVHNSSDYLDRRRELRKHATPQEEKLWQELRNNKLGIRFRRQHSFGGYILDFYCFGKLLIIEVDGESHEFDKEYDRVRDKYFADLGYRTLRVKNEEVDKSLSEVILKIKRFL